MIHVFLGTKAQYIKSAPVLQRLDAEGVPYRLIDSGQHAALAEGLRTELGVRAPDHRFGDDRDVTSIPQAALWAARIALGLVDGRRIRREVFGGQGGVCVVHGDTPSTLLSCLLARRAGLEVAHLEAGLRSPHLWHPFPEEAIRRVVMRLSSLLFAPDEQAVANLRRMGVKGRIVALPANTVVESLARDVAGAAAPGTGPAIVTLHRVENLNRRSRVDTLLEAVARRAATESVRFVAHGPTLRLLARTGRDRLLTDAGAELVPLQPHAAFARSLHAARWVITDGGSIQEECALLGVPTLLWRGATERHDGLGHNVVLARYDRAVLDRFLADPEPLRRPGGDLDAEPSRLVVDELRPAA